MPDDDKNGHMLQGNKVAIHIDFNLVDLTNKPFKTQSF